MPRRSLYELDEETPGPRNISPRFGVEIEFTGTSATPVEQALATKSIFVQTEDYNHRTRDYWKIVPDQSAGLELVSPPLEWGMRHTVRDVMQGASQGGARVTVDCGLHVHHEFPWYSQIHDSDTQKRMDRLVEMYENCKPLLERLLTPSRLADNEYVMFNTEADRYDCDHLVDIWSGDQRYVAVNGFSLPKYGTVEFRQHQGTLNPSKALAWIEFTRQLVHAAATPADMLDASATDRERSDARWALVFNKMSTSTRRYMTQRTEGAYANLTTAISSKLIRY